MEFPGGQASSWFCLLLVPQMKQEEMAGELHRLALVAYASESQCIETLEYLRKISRKWTSSCGSAKKHSAVVSTSNEVSNESLPLSGTWWPVKQPGGSVAAVDSGLRSFLLAGVV